MNSITDKFKQTPYWWDDTPRPKLSESCPKKSVDVLIIGSGYTGLCAAIELSRAGRQVMILDAKDVGWGCSSRNGGQLGTGIKSDYPTLAQRYGTQKAFSILKEGQRSLEWIQWFIESEGFDCDYEQSGRFCAAHSPKQFEALERRLEATPNELVDDCYMVSRNDQKNELGSDHYHGGLVSTRHGSLHPAKYHQALYERAIDLGVEIHAFCAVGEIERNRDGFEVSTPKGAVLASKVVVATSGYTSKATPWLQRRIIPIGSYMIATEAIDPGLMKVLMPQNRVVVDTRKLVVYYRNTPDRSRVLFGGRVSVGEIPVDKSVPRLRQLLVSIFPELSSAMISHCWMGFVGYTFDSLPHIGERDGLFYAMGYCGSGVALSSYFGTKMAQRLVGDSEGCTALDDLRFQTRPLYRGKPWFLKPSVGYYRIKDRFS